MNKQTITVGIMALIIAFSFAAYSTITVKAASSPVERWEYKIFNFDAIAEYKTAKSADRTRLEEKYFNQLGLEGWELAATPMTPKSVFFKRRLP